MNAAATSKSLQRKRCGPNEIGGKMKRLWVVLVGFALVICVGMAGAYFTARVQVQDNVIRAGTVALASQPASSALSAEGVAPGIVVARQLRVSNTGSLAMDFVVTGSRRSGITAFYDALLVTVHHGGRAVYEGRLNAMRTLPVQVGPGETALLDFALTLPAGSPATLQGDHVNLTLNIDAEQSQR